MSIVFPAATVVLLRDGQEGLETLLLQRAGQLDFGGGAWVFPGGRLDQQDYADDAADIEAAARRAAVRETREEASLCIDEKTLLYFSHWLTPAHYQKRFATWFYLAEVATGAGQVEVDNSEIVSYQWCRPAAALAACEAGKLSLMRPTVVILGELATCQYVSDALQHGRQRPARVALPKLSRSEAGLAVLYPGDQGYSSGNPQLEGPRNRLWVTGTSWHYELSD